jgi:chromosomal replication initiation ATPase DnaA
MIIKSELIQKTVCAALDVPFNDRFFTARERLYLDARYLAIYYDRKINKCSLFSLAMAYKKRSHCVIIHGLNEVKKWLVSNPEFIEKENKVNKAIEMLLCADYTNIPQY